MSQLTKQLIVSSRSLEGTLSRTGNTEMAWGYETPITLPAAKAGTLSTRTNNTEGTLTLSGGHGISTGNTIDVFWDGGRRYGVTVGTVSGNDVPISGGAGDNLPAEDDAVTASTRTSVATLIDGDALSVLGIKSNPSDRTLSGKVSLDFRDSGGSTIEALHLSHNSPYILDVEGGDTNVFTGNIVESLKASNGSSDQAVTLTILLVANA